MQDHLQWRTDRLFYSGSHQEVQFGALRARSVVLTNHLWSSSQLTRLSECSKLSPNTSEKASQTDIWIGAVTIEVSSTHEEAGSSERLMGQRSCLPICHIVCRDMPDQLETPRETLVYFYNMPNMAASAMLTSSSALSVFSLIISNPQYSKDREPRTLPPSTHGLVTMHKICTFLGVGPRDTLGFHQSYFQDLLPSYMRPPVPMQNPRMIKKLCQICIKFC